jgi:hypothetical protein
MNSVGGESHDVSLKKAPKNLAEINFLDGGKAAGLQLPQSAPLDRADGILSARYGGAQDDAVARKGTKGTRAHLRIARRLHGLDHETSSGEHEGRNVCKDLGK